VEIPGVRVEDLIEAAGDDVANGGLTERVRAEAERLAVADEFLERGVNIDFSGGEQKRAETLQLALMKPRFAILDELDSGLDVDALRDVSRRIELATHEQNLGVLAITHYNRLLHELRPDFVHVLVKGRLVAEGGPELAAELEDTGYAPYLPDAPDDGGSSIADPFADPFA
jgi:Fe-S cluster assembly ATP-binding protein